MSSCQTSDLYFAAFLITTNTARFTGVVENGKATRSLFVFAEPIGEEPRRAFFGGAPVPALAYAMHVQQLKRLAASRRDSMMEAVGAAPETNRAGGHQHAGPS
jgi:hypothetical protein